MPGRAALARFGRDGGFLFGGFSVADCMYAPVVSRFVTYGVDGAAAVKAYMDRMMALPAMQDWGEAAQKEVDARTGLVLQPVFGCTACGSCGPISRK